MSPLDLATRFLRAEHRRQENAVLVMGGHQARIESDRPLEF
jgi:hypothetical protein